MNTTWRLRISAITIAVASFGLAGCAAGAPTTVPTATPDGAALTSCSELVPEAAARDMLGDDYQLVQLDTVEPDSVGAYVDDMVTDGVACAATGDDTVLIGQLPMSGEQWTALRDSVADEGSPTEQDMGIEGYAGVAKAGDGPDQYRGFAWHDGVLYYASSLLLLALVPAFSS